MELPVKYDEIHHTKRWKVREEYIKLQNGLCYHCHQPLNEEPERTKRITERLYPPSFFNHPVHLHHSHDTGLTLGAVHCYCNAVLWEYHNE